MNKFSGQAGDDRGTLGRVFPHRAGRVLAVLALAAALALSALVAPAAHAREVRDARSQAAGVHAARSMKLYPLQGRSMAAQLKPGGRAFLPTVKAWAERVLGSQMDQPSGLTEVQNVSALHIYRAFTTSLGFPAARSAIRIAWRESRLLPNVVNDKNRNKTMDWGLFQLNDGGTLQTAGGTPGLGALRPSWNARAAARLIASWGWEPWGGFVKKS